MQRIAGEPIGGGWPRLSPDKKNSALPFSRCLREGGAFKGLPVTARLVDAVFQPERNLGQPPVHILFVDVYEHALWCDPVGIILIYVRHVVVVKAKKGIDLCDQLVSNTAHVHRLERLYKLRSDS